MSASHIEKLRKQAFAILREVGISGDDAKETLRLRADVASLTELNLRQWQGLVGGMAGMTALDVMPQPPSITFKQWTLLKRLTKELQWDLAHLTNFVKHTAKVDALQFLDVGSCRSVLAGMIRVRGGRRPEAA